MQKSETGIFNPEMGKSRYTFVVRQINRHGKTVWYFRRGKGARIRLPDDYGSKEFVAAWQAAMAGKEVKGPEQHTKQTLAWLVDEYQKSLQFKSLRESTQRSRRNILKAVCSTGGNLLISQIDRAAIARGRDRRAETPFAAVNYLKVMGYLFEWAVDAGYARENPVRGVKRPKIKTDGHTPWTPEDVVAFCRKHPKGTQERLAMMMLLFTGLRRSDVYLIGPQHIKNDVIEIRDTKTAKELFIPVHPLLKAALAEVRTGHMAYLVTPVHGRPFKSAASFGNWFGDACREAGVPGRAHGMRKSLANMVIESGASNAEMRALFGWDSDAMVTLYTRNANRRKLAKSAAEKLNENGLTPHLVEGEG